MGHQINFFLGPNDQVELDTRLKNVDELLILHSRSPTPEPRTVETINFTEDGKQWLFFYLVRLDDLSAVQIREVAAQGYWVVDNLKSPVIEVVCCYYNGKIVRRGRLYYIDGFYDAEEQWVEKPTAFKDWAKRLLAAARKTLTYDKKLLAHVGREALEMKVHQDVEFKSL